MSNIIQQLEELEANACDFGLKWETPQQIIDQIKSECEEIEAHLPDTTDRDALQMEIGDLIHAAFSLCVFCGFDANDTLSMATDKFAKRLQAMKAIANENGREVLTGLSFDELMGIWQQAKGRVG